MVAGGQTLILPSILIESCSYSQTLTVEFFSPLAAVVRLAHGAPTHFHGSRLRWRGTSHSPREGPAQIARSRTEGGRRRIASYCSTLPAQTTASAPISLRVPCCPPTAWLFEILGGCRDAGVTHCLEQLEDHVTSERQHRLDQINSGTQRETRTLAAEGPCGHRLRHDPSLLPSPRVVLGEETDGKNCSSGPRCAAGGGSFESWSVEAGGGGTMSVGW